MPRHDSSANMSRRLRGSISERRRRRMRRRTASTGLGLLGGCCRSLHTDQSYGVVVKCTGGKGASGRMLGQKGRKASCSSKGKAGLIYCSKYSTITNPLLLLLLVVVKDAP